MVCRFPYLWHAPTFCFLTKWHCVPGIRHICPANWLHHTSHGATRSAGLPTCYLWGCQFVLRGSSRVLFNQVSAAAHAAVLIVATFVNTLCQVVHAVPPESARLLHHRSSASPIIPFFLVVPILHCVAHTAGKSIELQLWAEMQLKKIISLYQPYSTLHCSNKWHCQASFETLGLDLFLLHPGDMQHWSWNRRFRVVQCGCNYWHKACSKKTCVKTNTMRNTNPITRNYLIQKNASTGNLQAPPKVQPPSKQGLSITMNHC